MENVDVGDGDVPAADPVAAAAAPPGPRENRQRKLWAQSQQR